MDSERPREELRTIQLKHSQAVEAGNARSGVDIPSVPGALDLAHRHMAVDEGAKSLDGVRMALADDLCWERETEKGVVDDQNVSGLDETQRLAP